MSLVTAEVVKALAGINAAITSFDTLAEAAADAGNAIVLRTLGVSTLGVHTYTEWPEVHTDRQRSVQVKHWPVVDVVALTNGTSLLTSDDYRFEEHGKFTLKGNPAWLGLARREIGSSVYWSPVPDGVEITYTAGWTSSTVPDDLVTAAQLIAMETYNRLPKAGIDEQRVRSFHTILAEQHMPPAARAILANYADAHV